MDLLLVWSDWTFLLPTLLGDGLGQFIDAGGGVVLAFWATSTFSPVDEYTPLGEFAQKYQVLIPERVIYGSSYVSAPFGQAKKKKKKNLVTHPNSYFMTVFWRTARVYLVHASYSCWN